MSDTKQEEKLYFGGLTAAFSRPLEPPAMPNEKAGLVHQNAKIASIQRVGCNALLGDLPAGAGTGMGPNRALDGGSRRVLCWWVPDRGGAVVLVGASSRRDRWRVVHDRGGSCFWQVRDRGGVVFLAGA